MTSSTGRIVEIRCGSVAYFGIGAIERFSDILNVYGKRGIRRVALITGKNSYKKSGAWDTVRPVLDALQMESAHYEGVIANPTVDRIDEAVEEVGGINPQLVIGIGGGSALDTSKAASILLKNPGHDARALYSGAFTPHEALPIVSINLTHGTGSEVDRYAVATIPEKMDKSGIGFDCIYPQYTIDDPRLTLTLPHNQLLYTSLDALNHVIEASTTTLASAYTVMLAREAVELIVKWLPVAVKDPSDLDARYWLLYSSVLGGIAIDCSVVHITHPLEHTLSAFKPKLEHGLGLCVLLPSVIKAIYPASSEVLAGVLRPIVPELQGDGREGELAAQRVQEWLYSMGVTQKLPDIGFSEEDIPDLVRNVHDAQRGGGSLSLSPVPVTDELIGNIYRESLSSFLAARPAGVRRE